MTGTSHIIAFIATLTVAAITKQQEMTISDSNAIGRMPTPNYSRTVLSVGYAHLSCGVIYVICLGTLHSAAPFDFSLSMTVLIEIVFGIWSPLIIGAGSSVLRNSGKNQFKGLITSARSISMLNQSPRNATNNSTRDLPKSGRELDDASRSELETYIGLREHFQLPGADKKC